MLDRAVDLTPYGKPAFGRLPTGLGKPAAGFPQLHSLDDDDVHFSLIWGLTRYRGTSGQHSQQRHADWGFPVPDASWGTANAKFEIRNPK